MKILAESPKKIFSPKNLTEVFSPLIFLSPQLFNKLFKQVFVTHLHWRLPLPHQKFLAKNSLCPHYTSGSCRPQKFYTESVNKLPDLRYTAGISPLPP
jgi:hypothetical protein